MVNNINLTINLELIGITNSEANKIIMKFIPNTNKKITLEELHEIFNLKDRLYSTTNIETGSITNESYIPNLININIVG